MRNLIIILLGTLFFISCQSNYPDVAKSYWNLLDTAFEKAGENATQLKRALDDCPKDQKEGMAFLISYMPERDLQQLSADFLLDNLHYAYIAKEKYVWTASLPDSIFLNEVLPYANISEEREPWRKDLYEMFSPVVDSTSNLIEAIFAIARPINEITGVEYNTQRSKVDLNPLESMAEKMATCTGLSILLTDAFRSVGIPSRLAGTPMWTNYRGNHTWSEVWIDGNWHFIEYYPDTLDKSWFLADAGKADPNNMLHWIYAVSYKPTGLPFYAVNNVKYLKGKVDMRALPKPIQEYWSDEEEDEEIGEPYIHAVNVTQRYIDLYEKNLQLNPLKDNELLVEIVVYKDDKLKSSDTRTSCRVEIYNDEKMVDFGYSPDIKDDLNKFLKFHLQKDTKYLLKIHDIANEMYQEEHILTGNLERQEFLFRIK